MFDLAALVTILIYLFAATILLQLFVGFIKCLRVGIKEGIRRWQASALSQK